CRTEQMPATPRPEERQRGEDYRADEDRGPEHWRRMDRSPPRHEVREEGRRGCTRHEQRPCPQHLREAVGWQPGGAVLAAAPQQPGDNGIKQYLPEFEQDEEDPGIVADRLSCHILLGRPRRRGPRSRPWRGPSP